MYHVHWRLNGTPFSGALDRGTPEVGAWYGSPAQEEALARLDFLYQQQRRLGLVLGDPGHGKSLLLRMFARRARRGGAMVALINLQGSGPEDLLWQTAITWGLNPARDETDAQLWRRLQEFLTQQSYLDVPTLLLLDDALDADPMPQGALLRLSQLAGDGASRLTMILSGIANRAGRLGGQLLELTDLRIELPAWRLVEVAEYLHAALERCGSRERIFADSAIQRLYDLTDGVPRQVNRLAELALVAGAADRLPEVDAKVVESVFHELARGV
jgi:type II secretory pathway predicted ATPase ExeA